MTEKPQRYETHPIEEMIITIRGHRVILDRDLAALCGVPTFRFNEAVKRNRNRFPEDFMFQLKRDEMASLTSQFAISKSRRGGRRTLPYAFTEHGAVMAANILRSNRAIQMSVFLVRAFIRMRHIFNAQKDLARKLAELGGELTARLDVHETAINEMVRQIRRLLGPPLEPERPKKRIGFLAPLEITSHVLCLCNTKQEGQPVLYRIYKRPAEPRPGTQYR